MKRHVSIMAPLRKNIPLAAAVVVATGILGAALFLVRPDWFPFLQRPLTEDDVIDFDPPLLEDCAPPKQKVAWTRRDIRFSSSEPRDIVGAVWREFEPRSGDTEWESDSVLWWVTEDEWTISAYPAESLFVDVPIDSFCRRREIVRFPIFQDLNSTISKILLKNGFVRSAQNSSESEDDETFDDYILGFEKEGTKCLLETGVSMFRDGAGVDERWFLRYDFTCSDQVEAGYAEQVPFLQGLGDRYAIVTVDQILGDFARIDIQYRGGHDSYAIMKRRGDGWELLMQHREEPMCSIVTQYSIPKEIYGDSCWDESGEGLRQYPGGPKAR